MMNSVAARMETAKEHDHLVGFYDTEAFLVETVSAFLVPALRDGDAAIVVATAAHRDAFERALLAAGIDVDAAVREGRFVALDVAETLSQVMVDGSPDAGLVREAACGVMDRVSHGTRQIRLYGEMVALLWDVGDVVSALALEQMWNELAETRRFVLLCAYPTQLFEDTASAASFRSICAHHTSVIPSEGYSMLADSEGLRVVAGLQQENSALRSEVSQLRAQKEILGELVYVDSLTGLANRRSFDLHLEREWALTRRDNVDSYVVAADLDRFKQVNDRCGHAAGDRVLQQFARALRSAARSTDIVARLGGDEFGVLLIRCDERAPLSFEASLREMLSRRAWSTVARIGVSLDHASLRESTSGANAFDRADLAMLARKHSSYAR